ncbi:MAG: TetM/TetW/TetO/TetS family tetracycline resistance ribosomal protection protein [Clostridia bacterium]|nr:TetM/TetW/TetO/TetS family tetracycline resistance ribosomal protection protein [Clostridia bacterium]
MENTNYKSKRKLNIAVLAHVDAGKTTLSEALLYTSGTIRKIGRVDKKDAYLDTEPLEKERGITIFSKQAVMEYGGMEITLLDTPGHVDFGTETERVLQVLDAAVLVVSGTDGVQGHTKTLWMLLEKYNIPVYIFINKMDRPGTERTVVMEELKQKLAAECVDFTNEGEEAFFEELAFCDEELLSQFLENGSITGESISNAIFERKVFPCLSGSALKLSGVDKLLNLMAEYAKQAEYDSRFGAKVFKITRDEQGKRITHLKVTGGVLRARDILNPDIPDEKVNQIRIYSGEKYRTVGEAYAGTICAVTGLNFTKPGMGLGTEEQSMQPILSPVLVYQVILPEGCDAMVMLPKLRELEEEEPELHILWNEELQEIHAQIMGEVQLEVLTRLISDRYGVNVEFGSSSIVYRETIANVTEGVGHFEPLRHYAEVHLIMDPLPRGSGLQFEADCSTDILDRNWQRLILTHLKEREHPGVLTGSAITDMKITLVSGRAHQKHTEGGDFREASYRAVRQGLKRAESVLLEPYYNFVLEIPRDNAGCALTDMERLCATFELENAGDDIVTIRGYAPVATMQHYQTEVTAYTKGYGRLELSFRGYEVCHNTQEVIETTGYDSERDLRNPTGSVFCAHGSGFLVSWDEVENYMHMESVLENRRKSLDMLKAQNVSENDAGGAGIPDRAKSKLDDWISHEEIEQIFSETFNRNKKEKGTHWGNRYTKSRANYADAAVSYAQVSSYSQKEEGRKRNPDARQYLLVDGYNVIFAWQELKELAEVTIDGARGRLLDIMCNYQAIKKCELIVVFDAYRVAGHKTEFTDYHNIHVVYTKEAETADQYIEKFAHDNAKKHHVTVATSDGLEQIIIRGEGCLLISAREFEQEVKNAEEQLRINYLKE